MKKFKILFGILSINLLFLIGILSYLYFQLKNDIQKTSNPHFLAGSSCDLQNLQSKITKSVEQTNPSVVNILISKNVKYFLRNPFDFRESKVIKKNTKIGGGSGIIISKDGLIITNKHVVQDIDANYSVVLNDGTVYKALKVWFDPVIDIAVLQIVDENGQIPQTLKPAKFQPYISENKVGQFVLAIGNALSQYQNSATFGIISATNRQLQTKNSQNLYIGLYQTDATINPGNSGGPLIDTNGQVLGINTAINQAGAGLGFSIPVNQEFITSTISSIKKYNSIKRPFLGIGYIGLNKQISKEKNLTQTQGVLITEVLNGELKEKFDIRVGDIITSINGQKINQTKPFLYNLYRFSPFEKIEINFIRGSKNLKKKLNLGSI